MTSLVDKDLISMQEVRNLIQAAKTAQAELATFPQEKIDRIVKAMAEAGYREAARLGKMASEETGFGIPADKKIKNEFGSMSVYESLKDVKTVGVIHDDKEKKITEIGVPMGVIAAIIPSTNPTSTVFYKCIISIKAGNGIVISPHPGAKNCTIDAAKVMADAAIAAGCPVGAIGCISTPTMAATNELMKHEDIALILATGGGAMVKAAYSSGNPAIGVGPGNGPAYIEASADIPKAVKAIMDSKCFDNGTICASEQSVVTEESNRYAVIEEFKKQGAYFLNPEEKKKVSAILMRSNGTMNPAIVGKTPQYIANLAGISIPETTRVIIGYETEVGEKFPFSKEKLCPVLAFYTEKDWQSACELSIRILLHEGAGHTMAIHSQNQEIIREFALKKPVSRLLVNTPAALGGVGATTNLLPSFTLGCGAVGGSSSSDNIGPLNLINIRRVAYGVRTLDDIRKASGEVISTVNTDQMAGISEDALIDAVLRKVLEKLS